MRATRENRLAAVMCVTAILGVLLVASAGAQGTSRHTVFMTFTAPVRLPAVTLAPGTYSFERLDPAADGNVIVVRSRDRKSVYAMELTWRISRPGHGSDVTFWETPAGTPAALRAWYPHGGTTGHEFVYPDERVMRLDAAN